MCGIVAILSCDSDLCVSNILGKSICELMNRGYDSMGYNIFSVYKNNSITSYNTKKAGEKCHEHLLDSLDNIDCLQKDVSVWNAIAHTRWATHGNVSIKNTHPICDSLGKKSFIVHNGIIENEAELRKHAESQGIQFNTDTDTETIIQYVAYFIDTASPSSYKNTRRGMMEHWKNTIQKVLSMTRGTFGIIIQTESLPGCLFCARRGSPLLIGWSENKKTVMAVSEKSGFDNQIHQYCEIDSPDVVVIEYDDTIDSFHIHNTTKIPSIAFEKKESENIIDKYDFYTYKEILEQTGSLLQSINYGARIRGDCIIFGGLQKIKDRLKKCKIIYLFGCGTSYYSALLASHIFRRQCPFLELVLALDASEMDYDILLKNRDDETCCIFISQSGETFDLYQVLLYMKSNYSSMTFIGIINVVDSLIAKNVNAGIYMNCGKEKGVASTKSFTSSILILYLISCHFNEFIGFHYSGLYDSISLISKNIESFFTHETIKDEIVPHFIKSNSILIVGKGYDYILGMESALKIKELAYAHAEAYSSSSLKHGPLALIKPETVVFFVLTDLRYTNKAIHSIKEILARNGNVYFITTLLDLHLPGITKTIHIPMVEGMENFPNLFVIIFFQLFAYHLAVQKGYNPDFPRNLAKVVTVE